VCPRGWVSHVMEGTNKVYCYLVRWNTHTWYMARKDCLGKNSDLLSITNAKEQEFVTKHLLAESFMWIGYNDLEREGAWAWSDRYCCLVRYHVINLSQVQTRTQGLTFPVS